jgi:hypothetical protein
MFDLRSTDDKFVLAVDLSKNALPTETIEGVLKQSGAIEVNTKQF